MPDADKSRRKRGISKRAKRQAELERAEVGSVAHHAFLLEENAKDIDKAIGLLVGVSARCEYILESGYEPLIWVQKELAEDSMVALNVLKEHAASKSASFYRGFAEAKKDADLASGSEPKRPLVGDRAPCPSGRCNHGYGSHPDGKTCLACKSMTKQNVPGEWPCATDV